MSDPSGIVPPPHDGTPSSFRPQLETLPETSHVAFATTLEPLPETKAFDEGATNGGDILDANQWPLFRRCQAGGRNRRQCGGNGPDQED